MIGSGRWTSQETDLALRLLGQGFPAREISRMTGRTETAVRLKLLALGYSSSQRDPGAEEPEADCGLRDIPLEDLEQLREAPDELRLLAARKLEVEELRRSERMRVSGAKEQILEQRIVDAFTEQMRDFRPPASVAPPPPPADPGESLTAVLVVSDAHISRRAEARGLPCRSSGSSHRRSLGRLRGSVLSASPSRTASRRASARPPKPRSIPQRRAR